MDETYYFTSPFIHTLIFTKPTWARVYWHQRVNFCAERYLRCAFNFVVVRLTDTPETIGFSFIPICKEHIYIHLLSIQSFICFFRYIVHFCIHRSRLCTFVMPTIHAITKFCFGNGPSSSHPWMVAWHSFALWSVHVSALSFLSILHGLVLKERQPVFRLVGFWKTFHSDILILAG